ncbi:hypothetical protein TNCV_4826781 [Trichonephila clavipes]|nr:hypothetical protein TNCV_4826781 [Trichonephila clavipes]
MEHVQSRLADDFQPGSLQPCVVPERQTIGQCRTIGRWVTEGMLACQSRIQRADWWWVMIRLSTSSKNKGEKIKRVKEKTLLNQNWQAETSYPIAPCLNEATPPPTSQANSTSNIVVS